jgi:hypothetical protein
MNLRKLPPSMLVVLGLSCTRTPPTVHPCLSQPYDPGTEDVGPCLGPAEEPRPEDSGTPQEPTEDGVEPCLEVPPCLSPPVPQHGASLDPSQRSTTPDAAGSRREALDRVLARATLPPDVAQRLRGRSDLD